MVARTSLNHLFISNGLLRLVIVDDGKNLKGVVSTICKLLCIACTKVIPENYRSVYIKTLIYYISRTEKNTPDDYKSLYA